jgi:pantothenate kinase
MDGFHYYRKDLTAEGYLRRGAPFTFDSEKFEKALRDLKQNRCGSFPDFDHKEKDPRENAILIGKETNFVVVEGLYLFYP